MTDKKCPKCGLWSLESAMICDCGYLFDKQYEPSIDESTKDQKQPHLDSLAVILGGLLSIAGIVLIVASIINPPTGGEGFFLLINLGLGGVLLLIGLPIFIIGSKIISRKNMNR